MCYEFFHCCSAVNRRKDTPVTEFSRQEATNLPTDPYADPKVWRKAMVKYQQPSRAKASWQLINTLLPFVGVWVAMYFVYDVSPWLTIPLMILAGGLCVRLFIIFHDCGHKSFLKSKRAGNIWGFITGILTFTPYQFWHWEHSIHHATSGDLDHREEGGREEEDDAAAHVDQRVPPYQQTVAEEEVVALSVHRREGVRNLQVALR